MDYGSVMMICQEVEETGTLNDCNVQSFIGSGTYSFEVDTKAMYYFVLLNCYMNATSGQVSYDGK